MRKLFALLLGLSISMSLVLAGCGEDPTPTPGGDKPGSGGENPTPGDKIEADITFYTSVNIIEQRALQNVAYQYEDMQYNKGNEVTVTIINNTDPDSYTQNLRNLVSGGVTSPTLSSVSPIPEYFGTDKLVDLSGYLEEPNPYSPDYDTWMDGLEPDAYRSAQTGSKITVPGVSYSSNYTCAFYDKSAMKAVMGDDPLVASDGTVDGSKVTWQWMMDALAKAKTYQNDQGVNLMRYPLGLSTSEQSCGEDNFNFVTSIMNMYLDQYFRDFIEAVHSEEGDYSYISGIDGKWTYDETDQGLDLPNVYTYNLNKVVDKYFNGTEYGPDSPRYKEMMGKLYELLRYCNPESSYHNNFDNFNRTTIVFNRLSSGDSSQYTDLKLFYIETLGYVRTYRDAFKGIFESQSEFPSGETVTSHLGWFLLPKMDSDLPGVADNVRAWGGPLENYGVLSTGSTSKDAIAVDFLRYLVSPEGQNSISATYVSENHAPQVMRQLVRGFEVPSEIDHTQSAKSAGGDSTSSPYAIFGMGYGMRTCNIGSTNNMVKNSIATLLCNYFRGNSADWNGGQMLEILKSGFSNYAAEYDLIYTDPSKVSEATNGLKNSPFNTTT